MNGYKCFYKGDSVDVYADTTLEAQEQARDFFQTKHPRRKVKGYDISTNLCELDGEQVIHTAVD